MDDVKLFTVEEADQTLPLVKKIVADILELGQTVRTLSASLGARAENDPEVLRLMENLEDLFVELEDLGCSYKDWNFTLGLVDFPAVIDGKEVCLCWRSDEPSVQYYHGLEEGFAGRRLIGSKE